MSKFMRVVQTKRKCKMSPDEKIQCAINNACVYAFSHGITNPHDFMSDREGIIYLATIYTLRNDTDEAKKLLKRAIALKKGTISSEERFKIEDTLYGLAEEIIREKDKAVQEIENEKRSKNE